MRLPHGIPIFLALLAFLLRPSPVLAQAAVAEFGPAKGTLIIIGGGGRSLVRGAPEGNMIMMAPGHEADFGLLKASAIDQHWATRKRERDLVPVIDRHRDLLGIGLDEDTAIIVQGDRFEVMGRGPVGVYDARSALWKTETPWLTLREGEAFDLKARTLVK